eukprot:ANDGO_02962.mRNA.1 Actophorin
MSTGVAPAQESVIAFLDLKQKHASRFVIYTMAEGNKEIVPEHIAPTDATYADFVEKLPKDDCRYAVYDYNFDYEGNPRNKLVFVMWSPDNAKIKSKMLYAASKDNIKKALDGIQIELQATDAAEIEEDKMLNRCLQFAR